MKVIIENFVNLGPSVVDEMLGKPGKCTRAWLEVESYLQPWAQDGYGMFRLVSWISWDIVE